MSVTTLLLAAAAAGDAVTLTFDDGSKPDALGIVIPVGILGGYLEAIVDPVTDGRKLFKLARIASVRRANGDLAINPAVFRSAHGERQREVLTVASL